MKHLNLFKKYQKAQLLGFEQMNDTLMIRIISVAGFILSRNFLSEFYMMQKSAKSLITNRDVTFGG
jgi:hypothetical protein